MSDTSSTTTVAEATAPTAPPPAQTTPPAAATTTTTTASPPANTEPKVEANEPEKSLLNQEDKKPEGEKKPEAKTGAPEKYEAFKVEEGYELDAKVAEQAGTLFKELGLNQDQGQKLVDMYQTLTKEAFEAPFKAYADQRAAWRDEVAKDPVIGNKLPAVKETISRALDTLGDAKLVADYKSAMDLTGAGDNPSFIRVIHALASRVVEGKHISGGGPSPAGQSASGKTNPPTIASAIYPNLPA